MSQSPTDSDVARPWRPSAEALTWLLTGTLLTGASLLPQPSAALLAEVLWGLVQLTPVIAIAAALAGLLAIADVSDRITAWIGHGSLRAVAIGSLAGALTPVCGLGIVPLIAVLLRRGLPLSAVMAFWVSSPVTDPGMLVVTAGVLGVPFAIAKTVAAFGAGVFAGLATRALPAKRIFGDGILRPGNAAACCAVATGEGWRAFGREAADNLRLIARWLALALVLEVLLQRHVPPELIESLLGSGGTFAIPLAAIVGAPLYLDGYAALPLVRGLAELGMTPGAVMALLISGAAVSVYAAVAVFSLVRWPVFLLYLGLAVASAMLAGYAVDALGLAIASG